MDDWGNLLMGQMTYAEAASLLKRGAADLHKFLETHPQAAQHFEELFSRRLADKPSANTSRIVYSSMLNYLGQQDLADLIAWTAQADQTNRIREVEKYASPQVMSFLRTLIGVYGPDLETVLAVQDQIPNDWRFLNRDVYYDQVNRAYRLRLRIEKFSGEEVLIETYASPCLGMTNFLIETLLIIGNPDAFNQTDMNKFGELAPQLLNLLKQKITAAPNEPQSAPGSG